MILRKHQSCALAARTLGSREPSEKDWSDRGEEEEETRLLSLHSSSVAMAPSLHII